MADIVAKVFSGRRTKILRAADALCARRREGPDRFIQNRSRTSAAALKSNAAADFREIFKVVRFWTFATISVKSRSRNLAAGCLLCPGERTSSSPVGMSEKCHFRTDALQQTTTPIL